MDDFSTPGTPNAFGLYPSPCKSILKVLTRHWYSRVYVDNYPEPGKRPLSSTVPSILENEDGTFYAAIGGSGGSRIFPAVFQVLLNLGWGMDVSAAIEHGRLHDQLFPTMGDADHTLPSAQLKGLQEMGHNITGTHVSFSRRVDDIDLAGSFGHESHCSCYTSCCEG